jgi:hypothetical protein
MILLSNFDEEEKVPENKSVENKSVEMKSAEKPKNGPKK